MNEEEIMKEWFEMADKDLESAKFLKDMIPQPLEVICYHCQQSAEKYLKGYIASQNDKVIRTHDLINLNKNCRKYTEDFSDIYDECLRLTDYGVNVRYPFHFELKKSDMQLAIKDAVTIKEFILNQVKE